MLTLMFACLFPYIHDGDAIKCEGMTRSARLYVADAPEMPGACQRGRRCVAGDPYASRDHLRAQVAKGPVACRQLATDHRWQRMILQCCIGRTDLSAVQVAAGHAEKRYGEFIPCPDTRAIRR